MGTDRDHSLAPAAETARRRLFGGMPILVWILCGFFLAAMLVWSFTRVAFSAPDERAHVGAVLYFEQFRDWPGFKEMPMMLSAMRAADIVGDSPFLVDGATPRPDRPSFADLTDPSNLVSGTTINQMSQHPPLYYAILAGAHAVFGDALSFDQEVWVWRLVSALLLAPLPLLAAALARRLGAGPVTTIAAAALIAFTPGLQMIGGSVNNDTLLIAASGWALLGAGCVLAGDLRIRTAVWIGLALAVALLTKAFAIPVVLGVGAAYLVAMIHRRSPARGLTALAVCGVVAAAGGWWWVRNLLLYGTLQPAGHTDPLETPLSFWNAVPLFVQTFTDRFFSRLWLGIDGSVGGIGVVIVAVAITAALVICAVVWLVRVRPSKWQIAGGLALAIPAALTTAIVAYQSFRLTMTTGITAGAQGRYLFPALIGVVALFAVLAHRALGDRGRRVVLAVVAVIGLGITLGRMLFALARSWQPDSSSPWDHLQAVFAWSPLPYALSVAVYAVFTLGVVVVVVAMARRVARAESDPLTAA